MIFFSTHKLFEATSRPSVMQIRLFNALADGVLLAIGYRRLGLKKTRMMGLPGRGRSLTISSAVWIKYANVTDEQTNGQTPGDNKDGANKIAASRSKNRLVASYNQKRCNIISISSAEKLSIVNNRVMGAIVRNISMKFWCLICSI